MGCEWPIAEGHNGRMKHAGADGAGARFQHESRTHVSDFGRVGAPVFRRASFDSNICSQLAAAVGGMYRRLHQASKPVKQS